MSAKIIYVDNNQHESNIYDKYSDKNISFVQLGMSFAVDLSTLVMVNPLAASVFLRLLHNADKYNLVRDYSYSELSTEYKKSPRRLYDAIKLLVACGYIEIKKNGTKNEYILNPALVWRNKFSYRQYCRFSFFTEVKKLKMPSKKKEVVKKKKPKKRIIKTKKATIIL